VTAFSLLEVLFVMVILALMAGLATPRFANALVTQRVDAASRQIVADLAYSKRRARISSKAQTFKVSSISRQYTIIGMLDPDKPVRSYSVALAEEPYGLTTLSANFGGDAELVFNGFGDPDSGGTITLGVGSYSTTITIDAATGVAVVP
jgi:type II secretory pathway pseudopilin PulG